MPSLNLLQNICKAAHFTKKGKAYFRVTGDGVLQIVKVKYERAFYADLLYIGLLSMYGELQPEWFTSRGCIVRYPVVNCAIQKDIPPVSAPPFGEQVELLQSKVIPWLDSIITQKQLVTAITKLDCRWNDENKIAPYLACGEVNHAKKVVREIIMQHDFAEYNRCAAYDISSFDSLEFRERESDAYYKLMGMIDREDPYEIQCYLRRNYAQNTARASFLNCHW